MDAIGKTIKKVSENKMHLEMVNKIKQTTICDDGIDTYEKWINLPPKQREPVELVVSYDMVW